MTTKNKPKKIKLYFIFAEMDINDSDGLNYNGNSIMGIFLSRKSANKAIKELKSQDKEYDDEIEYYIEEDLANE